MNDAMRKGAGASVALLVVFLAAWQWGPGLLGVPSFIVPPLSTVAREFVFAWQVDHLLLHTLVTVGEVLAGFILGSLLGAFFGYLLGMSPTAELALSPYILALQIAPKVAFAPLFILWMGFTVYPKILVAILIVFFPVMVNVLTAVRTVDPDLINLARAFKATRAQIFWKIEFPTSMPPMFAGLRIGATLAVVGVVVGELVGGNVGLGYLLTFGEGQADTPLVFVSIVMLTFVGAIAYLAVILIERRVLHYLPARAIGGNLKHRLPAVAAMPLQHGFQYRLQGRRIGCDDLPKDSIVNAKVFVTDAVADPLYLSPRLRREVGEPVVRDLPHGLRNYLNRGARSDRRGTIAASCERRCRAERRSPPSNREWRSLGLAASNYRTIRFIFISQLEARPSRCHVDM